jgi:hypothetical protein
MKKVACGEFVKRQTKESGHSHFEGTWEELEGMVHTSMVKPQCVRPGYKDGVILVDLTSGYEHRKFYSAVVELDETTKLVASWACRRLDEAAFIRVAAQAKKQLATHVTFVCYRADVLAENNERETDAEWEIVAIKARTSEEEEPMDPYTMARNFLHLKGGTKGDFTAEQFAQSIVYWNNHVMCTGKPKWYRKLKQLVDNILGTSS